MAKKSHFMVQQRAMERAHFDAGLQMGRQQILDMMCLSLHDPKVMKKDTLGKKRLLRVIVDIGEKIDYYHHAWVKKDDTDAFRMSLDYALADAFGEEKLKDTFEKRYEFCPEFDYKNNKWKG